MYITVNDTRLYYRKLGRGKPLLLVHGNGESHEIYDKILTPLSRNYTVYAIDSRGCGKSDPRFSRKPRCGQAFRYGIHRECNSKQHITYHKKRRSFKLCDAQQKAFALHSKLL